MKQDLENIDERGILFWDKSYSKVKQGTLWGQDHVPFIEKITERFVAKHFRKIVDVPCGEGRNLAYMARNINTVIGVDASTKALGNLNSRLVQEKINNCVLLKGNIFELPFDAEQFDAVLCWDVLGHLRNVDLALKELMRICKSGGSVVGSLFALEDSTRGHEMRHLGNEEYLYKDDCYFRFFSECDVRALLTANGLTQFQIEPVIWREGPHIGYREYEHEHKSWCFTLTK